jgi:hypothetical protein
MWTWLQIGSEWLRERRGKIEESSIVGELSRV